MISLKAPPPHPGYATVQGRSFMGLQTFFIQYVIGTPINAQLMSLSRFPLVQDDDRPFQRNKRPIFKIPADFLIL